MAWIFAIPVTIASWSLGWAVATVSGNLRAGVAVGIGVAAVLVTIHIIVQGRDS